MIPNLNETSSRIREDDLIRPALLILAKAESSNHGPITTAQLKTALKKSFHLSDEDQAPLKNRSDTKIDQVIRNLVSHRTLERKQYAEQKDGKFHITEAGKIAVLDSFLDMIPMPNIDVNRKVRAKAEKTDAPATDAPTVDEAAELAQAAEAPAAPSRRRAP